MGDFRLDLAFAGLPGVPDKQAQGLANLGIATLNDLLHHFPRRYEDRRMFDRWPNGPSATPVCVHGQVTDAMTRRFGSKPNQGYFEIALEPLEDIALAGPIHLRWFNMPFMKKVLAAGMELVIYGTPKILGGKLIISHPDYEIIEHSGDAKLHMDRIVPVYPAGSGITQRFLRGWVFRALERLEELPLDPILPPIFWLRLARAWLESIVVAPSARSIFRTPWKTWPRPRNTSRWRNSSPSRSRSFAANANSKRFPARPIAGQAISSRIFWRLCLSH